MNAIEISGLSKTFKGKRFTRVEALKNLSLTVGQGEIFGFLGPNGAGKSTTIKTLMGLIEPSAGSACIMGIDISSPKARRRVGYLPENPAFYDYLSAEEYLAFVGTTFGLDPELLAKRSEEVLKQLELWEARKRPMRSYSKGMVQRVGLGQVLIHDPDVCILDEPMSGLDPVGRALVKEIMLDLKKRGKCVFFSTHIIADVESVCDRVGIILKGELQSVERVEDIMTRGVVGYYLTLRDSGGGTTELYVPKDELSGALASVRDQGGEVTLIEPRRKSLEDFFLDIIKGRNG
ncbi:ABC transporter ATP-binding protein [Geomonas sp. Red32]|uniref:ABC transporter ATP-binding protein n=1 Tax=Geomonas sp. Red32 TaxID=2912856 RepID=UPI00202CD597|nr:ABC transporter ATP-binding protein [Geomonas sp. Red32]MCM0083474.1 ABC transporter ATP-binding protein [Geomonas sp. Red32]